MRFKATLFSMIIAANTFAQGVIDVHSHIITPDFVSSLTAENRQMEEGFPLPLYDAEAHLHWMDEVGIQTSVLTLTAPHPSSALSVRRTNEEAARLKRENPGRFMFCAALPLPDIDAAIREVVYAFDTLGADGIKLATNARGQYLGTPALDTLFAVLNARHAFVILHPHCPQPVNLEVMQQTPLAMQEYLSETTRTICNMISRNVIARYPDIKIVVPHCGAYLPLALPRMKSLIPVMQHNQMVGEIDWEANLASLYYDLAGAHSPEVIRMLLTITTPDHLLYGSDYPYVAPNVLAASLERMHLYLTNEPDLAPFGEMIMHRNAEWLMGLSNEMPAAEAGDGRMICRIAEIEVHAEYLNDYLEYAGEVDRLSVEREPGVICLFPMQSADDPTQIRILEIYASDAAYQKHLKTEHFQKYKQGTMHMVKSLELSGFQPLDLKAMEKIFRKPIGIGLQ